MNSDIGISMQTELHKKAFLTNFEIACEAGIIALVADVLWLLHDISTNGISVWYIIVALGLLIGIGLTSYALLRHHKYYTHRAMSKIVKKLTKPKRMYKYKKKVSIKEAI